MHWGKMGYAMNVENGNQVVSGPRNSAQCVKVPLCHLVPSEIFPHDTSSSKFYGTW